MKQRTVKLIAVEFSSYGTLRFRGDGDYEFIDLYLQNKTPYAPDTDILAFIDGAPQLHGRISRYYNPVGAYSWHSKTTESHLVITPEALKVYNPSHSRTLIGTLTPDALRVIRLALAWHINDSDGQALHQSGFAGYSVTLG